MATLDTERFKQLLLNELADLSAQNEHAEEASRPVALDQQSVGRLSRMDALQGQAMALATRQREKQRQVLIMAALRRLEEGEYGECQDCGADINPKRLEVDACTRYCLDCASQREA